MGAFDDEGYLKVIGRAKDLIIRGGENVYPKELEEFFLTLENVVDVQVIGAHDDKYGEEVCAWIIVREPSVTDGHHILNHCHG